MQVISYQGNFFDQEVWIKRGVITSRSLDMYISKIEKENRNIAKCSNCESTRQRLLLKIQ